MRAVEPVRLGTDAGDLAWPIRRAAELFPHADALVEDRAVLTYHEMLMRIAALRGAIVELGVPDGGRIGFLGVNSIAHAEAWFAVPTAGRVLVDLNFRLALPELEFVVNDCEIQLLICDRSNLDAAQELRRRCASLSTLVLVGEPLGEPLGEDVLSYADLLQHSPIEARDLAEQTLAGICYTGGTTGRPKGVMLSHGNLLANARHNLITTGHSPEQRWLHVPPMFHVAGTANLFACTWAGATQVILDRFDARAFIEVVRRESITHCVLVPTMLHRLMDALREERSSGGLPTLRHIQYAASPITPALQRQVLEYFDCDIVQLYGMTEAAPTVTQLSAQDHRRGAGGQEPDASRLASIGRPVIGVEVAVVGDDGRRVPVGEVGELCVRGPNVMLGYWNREEATAQALAGGWYRTGDAVWEDAGGYLFLVDRLKDMIITGGENVYSIEVEAALAEHPAVAEVAVIGIPHPYWGEAVHAVVSLLPGAMVTEPELIAHCRELIAGYKVPRSIELRAQPLPRSGAGKLLKAELRQPYWSGHDRRVN